MAFKIVTLCTLIALATADVAHLTSYGYGVGPTTTVTHSTTSHGGHGHGHGGSGFISSGHGSTGFISGGHGHSSSDRYGSGGYSGGYDSYGSHGSATGSIGFVDVGPSFHTFNAADVGVAYTRYASGGVTEQYHGGGGEAIINKNFYSFSGPEDHSEHAQVHHVNIGHPEKNLKVLFIKNPSSSANRALIKVHNAPHEEKTVVYVLQKHDNDLHIDTQIDEVAPSAPVKPDVVFVKYQNNEEIAHLQAEVQQKLEHFGGHVHVSDEGHAPVRSITHEIHGGHGGHIGGSHTTHYSGGHYGSASDAIGVTHSIGSTGSSSGFSDIHHHGAESGLVGQLVRTGSTGYLPPGKK